MDFDILLDEYIGFLEVEKALAKNSVESYQRDLIRYIEFMQNSLKKTSPESIDHNDIQQFIIFLIENFFLNERSQSRTLSAIKGFHQFLVNEDYAKKNPVNNIDFPKLKQKLPSVLSVEEIDKILNINDLNTEIGLRNRAMLELLYSSGLRVSELINVQKSKLYFDEAFVQIIGKGNKERLVPVGEVALYYIQLYLENVRNHQTAKKGYEDHLFLNRRGKGLTRVMIFTIIKNLCKEANVNKNVSPHTFRHSFATHLIEGGADLKAVQEMLGHSSITTTEIYLHMDKSYLQEVVRSFHPRK